ncbi:acyl-CoA dehydrogenase/oxidase [Phascolomyces articulosus]|uniref:Acyl-CoA dehydrogenase/oxidase n=1 Tax=Phascolomyces articulosus TaxID=60185 RepID=A0AAD5JWE4_9FUNG|nr:acyl-CoA dehydrogenase/oxidase [Phascolomyces articulosus]
MSASCNLLDPKLLSPKFHELYAKAKDFIENDCIPAEALYEAQMGKGEDRWKVIPPILEELKTKARSLGLWNLFLGHEYSSYGGGLSNLEYSLIAELTGTCAISSEAMNCSAPDTGNMEVFAKYGNEEQKEQWLKPLLDGKIRSAFVMTEPAVASSDATNIETSIRREGNEYVINGRKWFASSTNNPNCKVLLVMGKTDKDNANIHRQQSLVIVPRDTPGIEMIRPLSVVGYDHAPHGHWEVVFNNVRIPVKNIVLGEGRGFEIIQGRLGPGRIHHCMRCIGMATYALDTMIARVTDPSRRTFGKVLAEHGSIVENIAKSRIEIEQARFLVLSAAKKIDEVTAKNAKREIAIAKVAVPNMLQTVADRAIQAHGAAGVSQVTKLPHIFVNARYLRIADGPDEVHLQQLGKAELKRSSEIVELQKRQQARREEILSKAKL